MEKLRRGKHVDYQSFDDDDLLAPPFVEGLLKKTSLEAALGGHGDLLPLHGKHARERGCFRPHHWVPWSEPRTANEAKKRGIEHM